MDCAVALRELETINVSNIMAFDVHDSRVQNAVPFMGFDDLFPIYQVKEVDVTKYMAYYIYCVNTGKSISKIMDPHEKIHKLLYNKTNKL